MTSGANNERAEDTADPHAMTASPGQLKDAAIKEQHVASQ